MKARLYSVCMCLLLLSALCPGTLCKRGGLFRGKGKSDSNKESQSQSKGLTKQGLKVVGAAAAAAGILGGTGTGLGFLGKGKNRSGHKKVSSHQHTYHRENQRMENRSQWNAAASAINSSAFLLFLVPLLIIWTTHP